jgi:hypothetical protein
MLIDLIKAEYLLARWDIININLAKWAEVAESLNKAILV